MAWADLAWREGLAAAVFATTFLFLALGRLGRWPVPRGASALVGGLLTALLLGVGWRAIDGQVILLIVALMAVAALAEEAGAFAGLRRALDGLPPRAALFAALAVMGLASALVLNDAAIVVLVPFLLPELRRLGLPLVRSVTLLAVAANLGCLLTPFGNPQDAVLASAAGLTVVDFLRDQWVVVSFGFLLLAVACRLTPVTGRLGEAVPPVAARGRVWLALSLAGFLAVAAVRPGDLGLGTAAGLFAVVTWIGLRLPLGRAADRAVVRSFDWNVVALFVGLYLLTGGLPQWAPVPDLAALDGPLSAATLVTVLSNTIGNVPAILTLLRLDPAWTVQHATFLVTTSTLGGALLLTGSAASLLAADQARKHGVEVRFLPFLRHAVPWVLPMLALGAWLAW